MFLLDAFLGRIDGFYGRRGYELVWDDFLNEAPNAALAMDAEISSRHGQEDIELFEALYKSW